MILKLTNIILLQCPPLSFRKPLKQKEKKRNTLKFQTMIQKSSQKEKRDEVYVAPDDGPYPCLTFSTCKILTQAQTASK